jgi:F-type H+-transporting ATPase subunit epsilon
VLDVELVSPEKILFEGQATFVRARTIGGGDIAFLTGHAPFIGALEICAVKIANQDTGAEQLIAVHGGFIEVSDDRVTILSDVAEVAEEIDVGRAEAARSRAEADLRTDSDDEEAQAALKRADIRVEVATGASAPATTARH